MPSSSLVFAGSYAGGAAIQFNGTSVSATMCSFTNNEVSNVANGGSALMGVSSGSMAIGGRKRSIFLDCDLSFHFSPCRRELCGRSHRGKRQQRAHVQFDTERKLPEVTLLLFLSLLLSRALFLYLSISLHSLFLHLGFEFLIPLPCAFFSFSWVLFPFFVAPTGALPFFLFFLHLLTCVCALSCCFCLSRFFLFPLLAPVLSSFLLQLLYFLDASRADCKDALS